MTRQDDRNGVIKKEIGRGGQRGHWGLNMKRLVRPSRDFSRFALK